ncbi:MAG: hypothetical protein M0Z83_01285 [Betaproteobacteria bacterium]|nr:hypothetical protein [Betaproteobacteria bacterium]
MRKLIYDDDGVAVFKIGSKYYIRYDAGTHQIVIREDEISEDEAKQVMAGTAKATQVLFAVQRRLTAMGVDPFVSNVYN